jgi:hypothetical protein
MPKDATRRSVVAVAPAARWQYEVEKNVGFTVAEAPARRLKKANAVQQRILSNMGGRVEPIEKLIVRVVDGGWMLGDYAIS